MDVVDRILWPVALAGIVWMAVPRGASVETLVVEKPVVEKPVVEEFVDGPFDRGCALVRRGVSVVQHARWLAGAGRCAELDEYRAQLALSWPQGSAEIAGDGCHFSDSVGENRVSARRACLETFTTYGPTAPASRYSDPFTAVEPTGAYPTQIYCSYICRNPLRDAIGAGRWDLVDPYASWFVRTGGRNACAHAATQLDIGVAKLQAMARALVAANMCTAVEDLRAELAIAWATGHAAIAGIDCD